MSRSGWISTDGRTPEGKHDCHKPYILAQSGMFAPKVGAMWACKCGRTWTIAHRDGLEWQEVERKLGNRKYHVRPGDTLSGLAVQFDISVSELAWLNGIRHPRDLKVDMILMVPAPTLDDLVAETVAALPGGWLRFAQEQAVAEVLRHLAKHGYVALSDVPREG